MRLLGIINTKQFSDAPLTLKAKSSLALLHAFGLSDDGVLEENDTRDIHSPKAHQDSAKKRLFSLFFFFLFWNFFSKVFYNPSMAVSYCQALVPELMKRRGCGRPLCITKIIGFLFFRREKDRTVQHRIQSKLFTRLH